MKSVEKLLLGAILSFLFVTNLAAVEVSGLNETEVIVADQSAGERNRALVDAFAEVLVKISGVDAIAESPEVTAELRGASRYLQQYRYRSDRVAAEDETQSAIEVLKMHVSFDQKAVERLLERIGRPVWGKNRPQTIVWLAVEEQGSRYLLDSQSESPWRALLQEAAAERGLPLILPAMDVEDQAKVHLMDVWANASEELILASQRYRADAILVARIYPTSAGSWASRWTLYANPKEEFMGQSWNAPLAQNDIVLGRGVHAAADMLAARFSVDGSIEFNEQIAISVLGINDLKQYAKVSAYLTSLDPNESVTAERVGGNSVIFKAVAKGGEDALRRAIALGKVLHERSYESMSLEADIEAEEAGLSQVSRLYYRLP